MHIALLLTGNELMTGDTVDTNSAMIAQRLACDGFDVVHKVTVGDSQSLLIEELKQLANRYSVIIINGGLGPTIDDLTSLVVASLCGLPLVEHPDARKHLDEWCIKRGYTSNQANLKQALLPAGAHVLANPVGSAVGFEVDYDGCTILTTPGVPSELRAMLAGDVITALHKKFPDAKARLIRRLKIFGLGESQVQQRVVDDIPSWPEQVQIGFRAGLPLLELKLEVDSDETLPLRAQCEHQLRALFGNYIIGENDETLAEIVVSLLKAKGQKLTLAESCTGGAIAAQITSVAGASDVFDAGIVSYSNAMKHRVLEVPTEVLEREGAVSRDVALSMAHGALRLSAADFVIAVTGIAGPGGGSDEKPVGTVWIAWGSSDNLKVEKFCYGVARRRFQTMITAVGLDLLRRQLQNIEEVPNYFRGKRS